MATWGWCGAASPVDGKGRDGAIWEMSVPGDTVGEATLSWGPHLPVHHCIMGKDTSLGKSSSVFPLLLRNAEGISQEVTTEEFDT